ncbi:MAG: acid stress-induced BolA-like protein IbaG/YrbA [Gammaproteobacteria bacterium]|jgi:acid stress-induced BolA-like protein IbaG/YrbA
MTPNEIKSMIEVGIPGSTAHIDGDDGVHFSARVISDSFADCPMIKQHKMVYAALGDSMESAIHALSIQTYTAAQWENVRDRQAS